MASVQMRNEPQVIRRPTSTTGSYWTPERDKKLVELVKFYGGRLSWNQISIAFPGVNGKCIKQRFRNHLDVKSENRPWTEQEDKIIRTAYIRHGPIWQELARLLPGRSVNEIQGRLKKTSFKDMELANEEQEQQQERRRNQKIVKERRERARIRNLEKRRIKREERVKLQDGSVSKGLSVGASSEMNSKTEKSKKKNSKKKSKKNKSEKDSQIEKPEQKKSLQGNQKSALSYLDRTYQLIERDIEYGNTDFFPTILCDSQLKPLPKDDIISLLLSLQLVVSQFWPMLSFHPISASEQEQTSFFLYSLYKHLNQQSKQLFQDLYSCEKEEYLMQHFQELIGKIQEFNRDNPEVYVDLTEVVKREAEESDHSISEQEQIDEDLLQLMEQFQTENDNPTKVEDSKQEPNISEMGMSNIQDFTFDQDLLSQAFNIEPPSEVAASSMLSDL